MAVKIRLQRHGRKKAPFYHIVIADSRSPRDGRFIDKIGTYNPMTRPATIEIDRDAAYDWIMKGAQPTDTVRAILRFKGVMMRKHLNRGVVKGALSEEKAQETYTTWIEAKEKKISDRFVKTVEEKKAFQALVFGKPKAPKPEPVPEVVAPVEEVVAATPEIVEAVAEPVAEVVETPEIVEAVAEPVAEVVETPEIVEAVAEPVAEDVETPEIVEAVAEPVAETVVEVVSEAGNDPELDQIPTAEGSEEVKAAE
jgi:small subunit ribosomal protein S16